MNEIKQYSEDTAEIRYKDYGQHKKEYRLIDRSPKWVTIDENTGEVINIEKYQHQDNNFSNLCALSFCRCQQ